LFQHLFLSLISTVLGGSSVTSFCFSQLVSQNLINFFGGGGGGGNIFFISSFFEAI
jgi:hypothetical protein